MVQTIDARKQPKNDVGASALAAGWDPIQAAPEATEDEALIAALEDGTGWISGCGVNQSTHFDADIVAGVISVGGSQKKLAATAVTFLDNTSGWARRDSVRADATGFYVIVGTPAPVPVSEPMRRDPDTGRVNEVLIATVLIPADFSNGLLDPFIVHQGVPPAARAASAITTPAVRFEPIISDGGVSQHLSHGGSMSQDFTWVDPIDGSLYVLWVDDFREPIIACRGIGDAHDNWDYQKLSGTALGTLGKVDGHLFVILAMDSAGFLHIAGNMHNVQLNYIRSRYSMRTGLDVNGNPPVGGPTTRDIHHWDNLAMTGVQENSVTYPLFIYLPDGTLCFLYRNGVSGDGDHYMKRYDTSTHSWTDLGQVLNGTLDNVSAYPVAPQVDSAGNVHFIWDWRVSGDADTNEGWYYMKITGLQNNQTMQLLRTDGSIITQPARYHGGSGVTSDMLPDKVANFPAPNLINATTLGIQHADANDHPHASFEAIVGTPATVAHPFGDPAATGIVQQFHLWYDGSPDPPVAPATLAGWHCRPFTHFVTQGGSWAGGTPAGSASRWQMVCAKDGRVFAIGCWPVEGFAGSTWACELTEMTDTSPLPDFFRLHNIPDQGDFHFDYVSIDQDKLRMLIVGNARYYSDPGDPTADDDNIANGIPSGELERPNAWLGLYELDLTQIDLVIAGLSSLPGLRLVGQSSAQNVLGIQTTSAVGLGLILQSKTKTAILAAVNNGGTSVPDPTGLSGNPASITIGNQYAGKILYARLIVNYTVDGANGWLACAIDSRAYQRINAQATVNGEAVAAVAPISDPSGNPAYICANRVESAAPDPIIRTTAWRALPNFRDPSGDIGRLGAVAWVANNYTGDINNLTIELAVLDY